MPYETRSGETTPPRPTPPPPAPEPQPTLPNLATSTSPLYREVQSCNRRILALMRQQHAAQIRLAEIEQRLHADSRLLKQLLSDPRPSQPDLGERLPGEHDSPRA